MADINGATPTGAAAPVSTNQSTDTGFDLAFNAAAAAPATATGATVRPDLEVLSNGDRGADVTLLQNGLNALGFNSGAADGIFGPRTEQAVRAFQQSQGIGIDGIVGRGETWPALQSALQNRQGQLLRDAEAVGTGTPAGQALVRDADRIAELIDQIEGTGSSGGGSPVTVGAEGSNADLHLKRGADIDNLDQRVVDTFDDIVAAWAAAGGPTPVITSGNDSRHSQGSLHFRDLAIDLRANNISDGVAQSIANDLSARLGSDFDVIFERFPNNPANDHIHLEYDPN